MIVTSTQVGTAALIGTLWFISTWTLYFDTSEREHMPFLRSESDQGELEL